MRLRDNKKLPDGETDGMLVDWNHQQSDRGIILSARVLGTDRNHESRFGALLRLTLNDRQLRAFTIDLVKASMMRGIRFEKSRRWWRIW